MKLNVDECYLMLVSRKHTLSLPPPPLFIHGDSQLQQVSSMKYLGLLLTSDLTWSKQIESICSKTKKAHWPLLQEISPLSPAANDQTV